MGIISHCCCYFIGTKRGIWPGCARGCCHCNRTPVRTPRALTDPDGCTLCPRIPGLHPHPVQGPQAFPRLRCRRAWPWPCLQPRLLDGPLGPTLWSCLLLLTRRPTQTPASSPTSPGAMDGARHQHPPPPTCSGLTVGCCPGWAPRGSRPQTLPGPVTGAWGAALGQGRAGRCQGTHQGWLSSQSPRRQRRLRGNSVKRPLNSSGGMWETMLQRDILGTVTCGGTGDGR